MMTGENNIEKICSKCCKQFPSSVFMELNDCGHIVCKVCIYDWINKTENRSCPFCKLSILQRQLDLICSFIQKEKNLLEDASYEKIYTSSGGVLVQRVKGILYYLAVQQKCNGELQWVSPKGRIEGNENSLEAAQREISEEVGLKSITLIDFISQQSYSYKESGKLYKKTVFWYLFVVDKPNELLLNEEEGFIKSKWITYEESIDIFSHESFVKILKVADDILNRS